MEPYDLAVIGAGIHGAAIAREAAARGHRVLVIERLAEPGLGTSSKSSKLIHGGLRYLETGQLRLVRECLRERRRLLAEHPGLVRLLPFHIPVYRSTRRRPWQIGAGLALYGLLGGGGFHRLSRREWPHLEGLKLPGLQAVFRYRDAQTDDRLLTAQIMTQARTLGAEAVFSTTVNTIACSPGDFRLVCGGGNTEFRSRLLVNATGPWVNDTLANVRPRTAPPAMELVQGTHILVDVPAPQGMYYVEAPADGRAVFMMPWRGHALIGTTETPYRGAPVNAVPLDAEIDYLLETWNHYFEPALKRSAVLDSFAGLRVLPAGDAAPRDRDRDTRLHRDAALPGLLSVCGGKLTTHRLTAERVAAELGL